MVMWVFGYGSLIWKSGFNYDDRLPGFIKGYRRVFYQGSTDHRGTRSIQEEQLLWNRLKWGVAYRISNKEDQETALTYLEVREKQYDKKAYVDLFTDPSATTPALSGVMVYIASSDKKTNENYLGPASVEEIAKQIIKAEGPSGPNREYLFKLEKALLELGCKDKHVIDIANEVRHILSEQKGARIISRLRIVDIMLFFYRVKTYHNLAPSSVNLLCPGQDVIRRRHRDRI